MTNLTQLIGVRPLALYCAVASLGVLLSACAKIELPAHLRPISNDSLMLLGAKRMSQQHPIFIRIFKEESEFEVWKQRADGRFYHFKTYPICTWSGKLGPKKTLGDKQAPEGFYAVNRHRMNPNSKYHLSFNLGYPNAFDRANGRTGRFLMVHGKCSSAGCYAMTDGLMEEIYALAREAFIGGQSKFHVHAFPFRMTDANLERHRYSENYRFWKRLKQGYDYFELTRMTPKIAVCDRQYFVNVDWQGDKPDPAGACPTFRRPELKPFWPALGEEQMATQRMAVQGVKRRNRRLAQSKPIDRTLMSGLTRVADEGRSHVLRTSATSRPDMIGLLIRLTQPMRPGD
ncbi:MAG: L,D-transpeptidase family protein [Hyphomicrobiaceae bacterium]